jgi:hypothetical protein
VAADQTCSPNSIDKDTSCVIGPTRFATPAKNPGARLPDGELRISLSGELNLPAVR